MKLGTHMPDGERRKASDNEVHRTKVKTKKVSIFCSIFRSCDLDLCPTNLIINRLPLLTIRHMCTKFHLDPTFCTHMPDGDRSKPIDIEVCRTKVKVTTSKNRTNI
jgi:hypothetical protein